MFCDQCGKKNREGARFCYNCGCDFKVMAEEIDISLVTLEKEKSTEYTQKQADDSLQEALNPFKKIETMSEETDYADSPKLVPIEKRIKVADVEFEEFIKNNVSNAFKTSVCIAPSIPEKKLEGARTTVLKKEYGDVIALFDLTVFGSAKDAYVFLPINLLIVISMIQ